MNNISFVNMTKAKGKLKEYIQDFIFCEKVSIACFSDRVKISTLTIIHNDPKLVIFYKELMLTNYVRVRQFLHHKALLHRFIPFFLL
mmetsp:Transcript_8981/g.15308  ORF Transcript_8981/g.15308 Transcript_8981/m.15308 type:complete len:87 (-) Transcript_8981:204-464(-)